MLSLLGHKPLADTNSEPTHSIDSTDSSREFWAEKFGIGRLISNQSDGSKPKVDSRWSVLLLLETDAVLQHDGATESQAALSNTTLGSR
jgi:hypothetical protein